MNCTRRQFLQRSSMWALGVGFMGLACQNQSLKTLKTPLFRISLAEWSLHRSIFGPSLQAGNWGVLGKALRTDPRSLLQGKVDHLDFARIARREFDIDAVEYVNTFFFDRARDQSFLQDMKQRADDEGVQSLLIMCDAEGRLGDPDE